MGLCNIPCSRALRNTNRWNGTGSNVSRCALTRGATNSMPQQKRTGWQDSTVRRRPGNGWGQESRNQCVTVAFGPLALMLVLDLHFLDLVKLDAHFCRLRKLAERVVGRPPVGMSRGDFWHGVFRVCNERDRASGALSQSQHWQMATYIANCAVYDATKRAKPNYCGRKQLEVVLPVCEAGNVRGQTI